MIDISRVTFEHHALRKVLMHRPDAELAAVTEDTLAYFNFAAVPDRDGFQREFDALVAAFREMGTEVLLVNEILQDDPEAMAYISKRANMTYTRDLAVVTPKGGILLGMALDGRKGDPEMIGRVFDRLGIPRMGQLEPEGLLEGGGITYFRGDTVIVGRCDRTNPAGLAKFEALVTQAGLKRMVTIPCYPGTVHIDGFLMLIDQDLALVHPPSLELAPAIIKDLETGHAEAQWMLDFLNAADVEMITVGQDPNDDVNFVMTSPRHIVGYEYAERVMNEVEKRGGKAIGVPGIELRKGNGGPHCMTCVLERG